MELYKLYVQKKELFGSGFSVNIQKLQIFSLLGETLTGTKIQD